MQGRKKTLEDALLQEASFPKDTSDRLLIPTKGRGINKETYRIRRMCLQNDHLQKKYNSLLDGFYTTMHTTMRQKVTQLYRDMCSERDKLGYLRFDEIGKRGFWKAFTMTAAQYSLRLLPGDAMLCLYGIYEKEIDDYVRSFYGADNLNNIMMPLLPNDPAVFFDDPETKLERLKNMLGAMAEVDKDAMQSFKDEEEEKNVAFAHFNCFFMEAMCVEWGIYKDLFGYELPYQAPFGTKKTGFGK